MQNAFTVDLEDWYQGIGLEASEWHNYEKRIRVGHDKLLNLFSKKKIKATYFILGKLIEDHPEIIKEIISEGHEIGCHTYSHQALYTMQPDDFRKEIQLCNDLIKQFDTKYIGFRAPYFSIDQRSWWSLDILKEQGFLYDSSIYPGDNKRTGMPGYPAHIHQLENSLWEAPISTFKILNFDPGLGGAYFRILPYSVFRHKMREINKNRPGIFYIHPWELDPEHPYVKGLSKRIQYTHYYNLKSTEKKIEKLLGDFDFAPLINIIKNTK